MSDDENSDEAIIDPYDDYDTYSPIDCFTESVAGLSVDCIRRDVQLDEFDENSELLVVECLDYLGVERLVNESIEKICSLIPVTPSLAKIFLHCHRWNIDSIINGYRSNYIKFLVEAQVKPAEAGPSTFLNMNVKFDEKSLGYGRTASSNSTDMADQDQCTFCRVCLARFDRKNFMRLACNHSFCKYCWRMHLTLQMDAGQSSTIECMESGCDLLVPEDFVSEVLHSCPDLRARYSYLVFQELVKSNPEFRFCPGPDCTRIIWCETPQAKKVICEGCKSSYCFLCGLDYHAPITCESIKQWLIKCCDDSETANYLSANTKDCPSCGVCIEKHGVCNHMVCGKCKVHFCWVCKNDWKTHGSEYYECSKYRENPNIATSSNSSARKWENYQKSLKMEEEMVEKIKVRIDEKVNKHEGTWIDWQYLYNAAALLTKCRYTLQYTYPYAYYMPVNHRKHLFEYQQAQLESEIENLAWKVEHAEATDKGDMQRQMHVAELRRQTLLKDFWQ